jgi:SH3-like domain-containing protein
MARKTIGQEKPVHRSRHRMKALTAIALIGLAVGGAQAKDDRKTPYWASISAGKAMMRTGPGRNYPATWLYSRADLPVKVVETYPDWRKVQDPSGETGWMLQRLLSDTRTAIVIDRAQMHDKPQSGARVAYEAEKGVVGRISRCTGGWCLFDVGGRKGYLTTDRVWGVDPNEEVD